MRIKLGGNIYQQLLNNNSQLAAFCGGNKRCGKCKIKILEGSLPITNIEKQKLSKEELNNNIRLACCHSNCEKEVIIEVFQNEKNFAILGIDQQVFKIQKPQLGVYIAIDIGTTTIVMAFINATNGEVIKEAKFISPQRQYGADVLSRVDASNKLGLSLLRDPLINQIEKELIDFFNNYQLSILKMVVVGNAVMTHLFMNVDPSSIAVAPYICKQPNGCQLISTNFFSKLKTSFIIEVLPPISAFVGADITAGLYYLTLQKHPSSFLLVDLGTNGEIVLFNKNKFYATAAAAGPAFEGGNMNCGVGSIDGAIYEAKYEDKWLIKTINQQKPIGICGSGYIQIIAQMFKNKAFDNSGSLKKQCQITPTIYINQKDIRNFQLAKSAVRTAIELICQKANIIPETIEKVYLSGGLGNSIKADDLIKLNIFSKSFVNKVEPLGNTALLGAIQYLLDSDKSKIEPLITNCLSFNLSSEKEFIDLFADYMSFDEI